MRQRSARSLTASGTFQFVPFRSQGIDPFELIRAADWTRDRNDIRGETLRTCRLCHQTPGILSVNTYGSFGMAANELGSAVLERETGAALAWKSRQFDWGRLQGLWRQ
jgi:hypothetical protein